MRMICLSRHLSQLICTAFVVIPGVAFADSLQGVVFKDLNGNGARDAGETGIANVRVSNGLDVVTTNHEGGYEISVEGDTVIFITKPAGYSTSVNSSQLPQFFYVHRPQGSPTHFRYPGVDATGDLPETVDFPLLKQREEKDFKAILFADPQPQTEVELEYIREDIVSELIDTDAKFGMTVGDILFDDLAMFNRYNRLVASVGVPWYNVPGNHELNFEATSDETSLETFVKHYGPTYYSFEYGDVVFFVLDNVIYEGATEPTAENPTGRGSYRGGLDETQMQWFKNELAHVPTTKLVFLAMHVPLNSPSGNAPGIHTSNGGEVLKLLDEYPHVYSVSGHMHAGQHVYLDRDNQVSDDGKFHHHVLSTVSGSWWSGPFDERGIPVAIQSDGNPNGYHILEVNKVTPSVAFKGAGEPSEYQMRITFDSAFHSNDSNGLRDYRAGELFDGRIGEDYVAATSVFVNLFDGGPRSEVAFRINQGELTGMTKVVAPDPHFVELQSRYSESMKSWLQAFPSQHLWTAKLPKLSHGTYVLTVEAIDEFGKQHRSSRIMEVYSN